ncbi:MAG: hypothetical protein ABI459_09605 [Deltaproteobacteria bacterium]
MMHRLMRMMLRGATLLCITASANAGCFPAGQMPARITYTDRASHIIIAADGESTTYQAFDTKGVYQNGATILSGIFLKSIAVGGATVVRYTWNGRLPTRKDFVVGAVFDVTGVEDSGVKHKVSMHIEVLEMTTARVGLCRYPAIKLSYVFEVAGAHGSKGTRVMDPVTMQTYRADFTATNPDGTTGKFHPVIAKLE